MSMHKQQKLPEQEQHNYPCRFCNKGFDSGRALGGHMRSHGIYNDQPILYPNEEGPSTTGAQRDSADSNCNGTSHFCKNCGEEFLTLRSFSKHCCGGGLVAGGNDDEDDVSNGLSPPSSPRCRDKGKRPCRRRSRNPPPPPLVLAEEERLANYLVLLSTAGDNPVLRITEAGECSTSGRKELDHQVVLPPPSPQPQSHASTQIPPIVRPLFECKTCQKAFTSHQALGGHRASHKKVKDCFATRLEIKSPKIKHAPIGCLSNNNRNNQAGSSYENMALAIVPFAGTSSQLQLPKKRSRVHECSICKRQFPSGQALGGHKRCHWMAKNSRAATVEPLSVVSTELQVGNSSSGFNVMHAHTGTLQEMFRSSNNTLDLNMPAPIDDFSDISLWIDVPTAIYLQPGRDNESENALHVNIEEEGESREVRLTNLSDLIDINEREGGSTWLQIGIGSISNQESRAGQP